MVGSSHTSANFSIADLDFVSDLQLEAWDVNNSTINQDVAVVNHLSCLENCSSVTQSPYTGSKSQLKKSQEVEAGIAAHSLCFLERVRKLFLKEVVVAADDLFSQELLAVLGLSAVLKVGAVLSGWVCAFGGRAFRSSPDVVADGAANIGLSSSVGRH